MRGREPVGSDVAANVLICVIVAGVALSVSSWLAARGVCSIQGCRVAAEKHRRTWEAVARPLTLCGSP